MTKNFLGDINNAFDSCQGNLNLSLECVYPSVLYLIVRITSVTYYTWAILNIRLFLVNSFTKSKLQNSEYLPLYLYLCFWGYMLQTWPFFIRIFPLSVLITIRGKSTLVYRQGKWNTKMYLLCENCSATKAFFVQGTTKQIANTTFKIYIFVYIHDLGQN